MLSQIVQFMTGKGKPWQPPTQEDITYKLNKGEKKNKKNISDQPEGMMILPWDKTTYRLTIL